MLLAQASTTQALLPDSCKLRAISRMTARRSVRRSAAFQLPRTLSALVVLLSTDLSGDIAASNPLSAARTRYACLK